MFKLLNSILMIGVTLLLWLALRAIQTIQQSPGGSVKKNYEKAIFAGGCFWCIESTFDETPGVISAISGYTGGEKATATYKEVSTGKTGHVEAVEVTYDPDKNFV